MCRKRSFAIRGQRCLPDDAPPCVVSRVSFYVLHTSSKRTWHGDEDFFNEIIRCQIPIDLNTLRAMKRSPLGLDIYLWLTYRTFGIKRPLRLTWPLLYRRFGVDLARAGDKLVVNDFRKDCLRELQKIQRAWPDLHYRTVKGALLLSPAAIAPSQLRLVE